MLRFGLTPGEFCFQCENTCFNQDNYLKSTVLCTVLPLNHPVIMRVNGTVKVSLGAALGNGPAQFFIFLKMSIERGENWKASKYMLEI